MEQSLDVSKEPDHNFTSTKVHQCVCVCVWTVLDELNKDSNSPQQESQMYHYLITVCVENRDGRKMTRPSAVSLLSHCNHYRVFSFFFHKSMS